MTSKIQVSFGRAGHILNISFKTIWPHLGQSYEAGSNVGHVDHMDQVDQWPCTSTKICQEFDTDFCFGANSTFGQGPDAPLGGTAVRQGETK